MQTVQKTEIRQVQFLDWDTPVVVQRQVLVVRQRRKLWSFRSCSRCSSWKVVDMPVHVQRQVGSDSAENRAGAAGAVHRRGVEPL